MILSQITVYNHYKHRLQSYKNQWRDWSPLIVLLNEVPFRDLSGNYFLLLDADAPLDDDIILPPSRPPATEARNRPRPFSFGTKRSYSSSPATHNQRNSNIPLTRPVTVVPVFAFFAASIPPKRAPENTTKTVNIPDIDSSSIPPRINADIGNRRMSPRANPARLPKRTEIAWRLNPGSELSDLRTSTTPLLASC